MEKTQNQQIKPKTKIIKID